MFAYERKRSEGKLTAYHAADPKRHDWLRGWLMRGLQIRFNEDYKQQSHVHLRVSPELEKGRYLIPLSLKEAGKGYYYPNGNAHFPLLENEWDHYYHIRDESKKWFVILKGNNAQGVGIECHYDDNLACSMQQITGSKKTIISNYPGYGKRYDHSEEHYFHYSLEWKRSDYDKLELKVYNHLCNVIDKMTVTTPDATQSRKRSLDAIE
jgi:hypothetical protein